MEDLTDPVPRRARREAHRRSDGSSLGLSNKEEKEEGTRGYIVNRVASRIKKVALGVGTVELKSK